jgi:fructose-1-phosphate kinase PfkB-like protein
MTTTSSSTIMPPQLPLIVVGLNPALQKRFVLPPGESLVPGNVHRAAQIQDGVGGKGQDVAITLQCLSSTSPQQLVQFVGRGSAGEAVHDMLVDRLGESAMTLTVRSESGMRTCTSIVAADDTTELVEPSGIVTESELQELYDKTAQVNNEARGVCIMGSMPPGCPSETYATLYGQTAGPSTVCVVDSVAGITELIAQAKVMKDAAGPIIFKVNASELCKLAGVPKSKSETGGVDLEELVDAIQQFDAKFAPQDTLLGLAITDGRHPAYFVSLAEEDSKFEVFQIQVPTLDSKKTLYPIGAGDAVAAGTLAAWVDLISDEPSDTIPRSCYELLSNRVHTNQSEATSLGIIKALSAFSFGLVCGSASCLQEENSVLDTADVLRLLEQIPTPQSVLTKSFSKLQNSS